MISGHHVVLCKTDYHLCVKCCLDKNILLNWIKKVCSFNSHTNIVSLKGNERAFWRGYTLNSLQLCIKSIWFASNVYTLNCFIAAVKIQNPAIEMCTSVRVTFVVQYMHIACVTYIQLVLRSQNRMLQNCGIDAHRRLYSLLTWLSTCNGAQLRPSLSLSSELEQKSAIGPNIAPIALD